MYLGSGFIARVRRPGNPTGWLLIVTGSSTWVCRGELRACPFRPADPTGHERRMVVSLTTAVAFAAREDPEDRLQRLRPAKRPGSCPMQE